MVLSPEMTYAFFLFAKAHFFDEFAVKWHPFCLEWPFISYVSYFWSFIVHDIQELQLISGQACCWFWDFKW